ncbi:MAG: hypothetical protein AAFN91_17830 [Pseudomonadota bacterium]
MMIVITWEAPNSNVFQIIDDRIVVDKDRFGFVIELKRLFTDMRGGEDLQRNFRSEAVSFYCKTCAGI